MSLQTAVEVPVLPEVVVLQFEHREDAVGAACHEPGCSGEHREPPSDPLELREGQASDALAPRGVTMLPAGTGHQASAIGHRDASAGGVHPQNLAAGLPDEVLQE